MAVTNALLRHLPGTDAEQLKGLILEGIQPLLSLQNLVLERKRMLGNASKARSRDQVSPLVTAIVIQRILRRASSASTGLPKPLDQVVLATESWGYDSSGGEGVSESFSELPQKKVLLMLPVVVPPTAKLDFVQLQQILQLPQNCGFVGGCGQKGYYIFGSHGDQFLALDPHFISTSYHCRNPTLIKGSTLANSLLLVFVLSVQEDVIYLRKMARTFPYLCGCGE